MNSTEKILIDIYLKKIGREDLNCDKLYERSYNYVVDILEMPEWKDPRFAKLLTSTIWHSNYEDVKDILSMPHPNDSNKLIWDDERFANLLTSTIWHSNYGDVKNILSMPHPNDPKKLIWDDERFANLLTSTIWNSNYDDVKNILSMKHPNDPKKLIWDDKRFAKLLTSNIWNSNYEDVKNAYDKSANHYTDISNTSNIISIVSYSIIIVWSIIMILKETISAIIRDNEQNAEKIFCKIKANKKDYFDIITTICVILAPIILPLLEALLAMNAKAQIESNSHYTVTQIENYLYYYFDDGTLMCKVFLNNFKFCNGVSWYIAIPIILFVCTSILEVINIVMKHKLIEEISNENLDEPQTAETATNENNNE